jgi:hypothetical protein
VLGWLHTSDWWKNADKSLAHDLVELDLTDSKPLDFIKFALSVYLMILPSVTTSATWWPSPCC